MLKTKEEYEAAKERLNNLRSDPTATPTVEETLEWHKLNVQVREFDLRLASLEYTGAIIKSGYGGMQKGTGMIVDRREHPDAIPLQRNSLFGTPEPKKL